MPCCFLSCLTFYGVLVFSALRKLPLGRMAFHGLFMSSKSSSLSLTIIIITLLVIVIMLILMIMLIIMIINYLLMYFSGGSKWKTRRRQITPTFHFRILNNFIQVFEEQAVIMVSHLEVASPVELVIEV